MDGEWIPDFSLSSESFTYSADQSLLDVYEEFWININFYFICLYKNKELSTQTIKMGG